MGALGEKEIPYLKVSISFWLMMSGVIQWASGRTKINFIKSGHYYALHLTHTQRVRERQRDGKTERQREQALVLP